MIGAKSAEINQTNFAPPLDRFDNKTCTAGPITMAITANSIKTC